MTAIFNEFRKNLRYGVKRTWANYRELDPTKTKDLLCLMTFPVVFFTATAAQTYWAYWYRRHNYGYYCRRVLE